MILIVGREYHVKGYGYTLKLVSLYTSKAGELCASLQAGAMTLHTTIDCIIGEAPCQRSQ